MAPKPSSSSSRRGVTLLELILALSLSILVLMAISMAINLFFRLLDVRRTNVEETRVASAVLKHVAADLRGVVQYSPPDLSGLESLTASLTNSGGAALAAAAGQMLSGSSSTGGQGSSAGGTGGSGQQAAGSTTGGSGGSQPWTGQGLSPTATRGNLTTTGASGTLTSTPTMPAGGGTSSGTAQTTSSQTGASAATVSGGTTAAAGETASAETTESTTPAAASFRGTATELRFDVSRLPRVDQFLAMPTGDGNSVEIPSDIKTVVYFLQNDDNGQAVLEAELGGKVAFAEPSTSGRGRGLMRAEQDRAVLALAESSGDDTIAYSNATLLATEVVGLAFQYFDGTEWLTEWDSAAQGGLPRAVEIVLTLQPTYALTEQDLASASSTDEVPEYTFRQVVALPSAPLVAPAPAAETTDPATSSSSATSSAASGSGSASGAMP